MERDADKDGRIDQVAHMDPGGNLVRLDIDSDRDGVFDKVQVYREGRLVHIESDRNGDGKVDTRDRFENEKRVRHERLTTDERVEQIVVFGDQERPLTMQRDTTGDGRFDTCHTFEDGRLARATRDTDGNQVVDTPEWMLKTGLILRWGDFEVVLMLRDLDDRYGDAANTEGIDDYVVVDLKIGYTKKNVAFAETLNVSLECTNLFDEQYIWLINAMDDSRAGSTGYYVGAPFTALVALTLEI